jgi:hypothetical protein
MIESIEWTLADWTVWLRCRLNIRTASGLYPKNKILKQRERENIDKMKEIA